VAAYYADNMHKKDRHNALLSMIATSPIGSQGELAAKLCEHGFSVTQASVSRDLDELGVIKIDGRYTLVTRQTEPVGFGDVTFDTAGDNLIVGRCLSGLASAITVRIDASGIPEIVGTIAGDDTIFIAVKNGAEQRAVLDRISGMFG